MVMIPTDVGIQVRNQTEPGLGPIRAVVDISADFPELGPGQVFRARIQDVLPENTYKALVAGKSLTLSLQEGAKAGATLKPLEYAEDESASLRFLLSAEAAAAFDDITRDGKVNQLRGQQPNDWPNTFRSARLIPAVEYLRAQRGRALLMRRFEKKPISAHIFLSHFHWDHIQGFPFFGPAYAPTNTLHVY